MIKENLNKNDLKLLAACMNRPLSMKEISDTIGLAPKNVTERVKKLSSLGHIIVQDFGKGKQKRVRTKEGIKIPKFMAEVLRKLKISRGKEMKLEDFTKIFSLQDCGGEKDGYDKFQSVSMVLYANPQLVDHIVRINEKGEKFLKENSK